MRNYSTKYGADYEINVTIYCKECKNSINIDDEIVICQNCHDDKINTIKELEKNIDVLKRDINYYEEYVDRLCEFKDKVINDPECPKRIMAEYIADKL